MGLSVQKLIDQGGSKKRLYDTANSVFKPKKQKEPEKVLVNGIPITITGRVLCAEDEDLCTIFEKAIVQNIALKQQEQLSAIHSTVRLSVRANIPDVIHHRKMPEAHCVLDGNGRVYAGYRKPPHIRKERKKQPYRRWAIDGFE